MEFLFHSFGLLYLRYVKGEAERPHVVFPLWVMDQLIISEEGEEAPKLDAGTSQI